MVVCVRGWRGYLVYSSMPETCNRSNQGSRNLYTSVWLGTQSASTHNLVVLHPHLYSSQHPEILFAEISQHGHIELAHFTLLKANKLA